MKGHRFLFLTLSSLVLLTSLTACSRPQGRTGEDQSSTENSQSRQTKKEAASTYSNLNSNASVEQVRTILSASIDQADVNDFLKQVEDYNAVTGSTGLIGTFEPYQKKEYDLEKITSLWKEKKGDFIGTNCRINTYLLLKNKIQIPSIQKDDSLLFMDLDAIDKGKLLSASDKERFTTLFSKVKTEDTQDVAVHAKKMEEYFKQFTFDEEARMLSVIVHDNLDGQSLFVGHVGVLVPDGDGYLFVEKLTFEEPYQAIHFTTIQDCYDYLGTKYQDYTGEGLAKPFVMDNGKWIGTSATD
ncbi:DUF4300 family protein [Streptococcus sp. DD13]|uniref:DUF4300 family protein n=1 Tax=Streptococcus sp. DD13 TaxID=1777881 RepID=UPI003FA7BE26